MPPKKTHTIGQETLLKKLRDFSKHIQAYESAAQLPQDKQQTPDFTEWGLCFGLCAYLAHCVLTENNKEILTNPGLKTHAFVTNPSTSQEFYKAIDFINKSVWPVDANEQKAFYHKMQYFLTAIIQLHANDQRTAAQGTLATQNMENILNEATRTTDQPQTNDLKYSRKTIASYIFTTTDELAKWAEAARPGDVLSIGALEHQMLMYATQRDSDPQNVTVGFYDPNHSSIIEEDQKKLLGLPRDFNPFEYCEEDESLICHHIVAGNNMHPPIAIPSSQLKHEELLLALSSSLLEQSHDLSMKLIKEIQDRDLFCLKEHLNIILDNQSLLNQLIERKLQLTMRDEYGGTLLHVANESPKFYEACNMLLKNADKNFINSTDHYGNTPLHSSVMLNNKKALMTLLEHGADIHAKNHMGNTALHSAILARNVGIVKPLLSSGANPLEQNNLSNTCLDLAKYDPVICPLLTNHTPKTPSAQETRAPLKDITQSATTKAPLSYATMLKSKPQSFVKAVQATDNKDQASLSRS
jgi:hypothetical protein